MTNDPYSVLGVARDADEATVRDAYRRLAKRYHPDLHPGEPHAARKMNELNEAYEAIRHPSARPQSARANPYAGYAQGGGDVWEEIFRQAEQQQRAARPRGGLRFGRRLLTAMLGYLLLSFLLGGCARLLGGVNAGRASGFPFETYQTVPFSGTQED